MNQMSAILSCFGVASASKIDSAVLDKLIRVCSEDGATTNINSVISEDKEAEMKQIIQNAVNEIEGAETFPFTQLDTERNIFVSPVKLTEGSESSFAIIAVRYDEEADKLDMSVITEGNETELSDTDDIETAVSELVNILTA
jgi:hypothetical protein